MIYVIGKKIFTFKRRSKSFNSKKYIIPFDSGVIVIRHWRMNNYLQKDRTKPTIYQEELKKLGLDDNNVYILDTSCIHSIDKNSIDKNSIEYKKPTLEEVRDYCINVRHNNVDYQKFYDYFNEGNWIDSKGNKVKNWKQKDYYLGKENYY